MDEVRASAARSAGRPAGDRAVHRRRLEQLPAIYRGRAPGALACPAQLVLSEQRRRPGQPDPANPQINGLFDTETGPPAAVFQARPTLELQPQQDAGSDSGKLLCSRHAVPADRQPSHALSQLGNPDLVPTADEHAEGERRHAIEPSRAGELQLHQRAVPGARDQYQQLGTQPGRDHRERGTRRRRGDYPIRIFSIGMGELVRYDLGTLQETSESILKRVANDKTSPDFNGVQLEGKYYYARTEADVGPAFQQLQSQIIRLSK